MASNVTYRHLWPNSFLSNYDKSATIFCCLMAALVTDMFYYFDVIKNFKTVSKSATTEARVKICTC